MKHLLFPLLTLLLNVGCNDISASGASYENPTHQVTIVASTHCATDTRVNLTDDSAGGYTVNWSEGDKLGGWFAMEDNDSSLAEFTMAEYGTQTSTFTGSAPSVECARFVYPYSESITLYAKDASYNNAMDISLSEQVAQSDLAHMTSTTYMVSQICDMSADTQSLTNLSMRHLASVIELNLKCDDATNYKLINATVDGDMIPAKVCVDLTRDIEEEYFEVLESGAINIEVPQFESIDGIFTLPFTSFPFEIANGDEITVTATFIDDEGAIFEMSKSLANSSEAVTFARATKNTLNVALGTLESIGQKRVEITWQDVYQAAGLSTNGALSPSKENNSFTIGDIDLTFSYLGLYDEFRFYASSTITFESLKQLLSIDLGCDIDLTISEGGGVCTNGKWEGIATKVVLKNSASQVTSSAPITIVYSTAETSSGEVDDTPPSYNESTAYSGWAELPEEQPEMSGNYYYAYHMCEDTEVPMRNFSVCYSKDMLCPVWVAAPLHECYIGDAERQDKYIDDPDIPFEQGEDWDGYDRGHLLASSDRTISKNSNDQAFYRSNIGPQIDYGFNRSGGAWRYLEKFASEDQICSDTLYVVSGCYWANTETISTATIVPTHYFKAMLRTKSGSSGKAVWNCTSDELKCAGFLLEHKAYESGSATTNADMMMSITELEELTGHTFFTNAPNAPKDSYSASEWGL